VLVWCHACHHQAPADLQTIIDASRGNEPLKHLRFRHDGAQLIDQRSAFARRSDVSRTRCNVCVSNRSPLLNSTKRIVGRLAASARRHQAHRVTLGSQEATEVVRATARFHSHDTGRHRFGEGGNILQPDSPLDDCASSLSRSAAFLARIVC
jgi:hypothetical protein